MSAIVNILDQYYLARQCRDTQRQLELADVLVERWIPELLTKREEAEEETHG